MKILLSHAYFLHEDENESKIMKPYPPQGLLHIGTYLRSKGMDCSIYDSTFRSFIDFSMNLENSKPTYLGLYVNLMTRSNVLKIIKFIRESNVLKKTIIILGGPDIRHHSKKYIEKGADFCIAGEGENTIFQLIKVLESNNSEKLSEVKGISYYNQSQNIVNTEEADFIKVLDEIPFPDFEMIDLDEYFSSWKKHHGFSSITISSMRGCPYSCKWCSKSVFGQSFRRRTATMVVKEIEKLQKQYKPDQFWIVDDVFNINKNWLIEFTNCIKERNIEIKYECICRADCMDDEVIKLLKESGCFRVWIGAESGSQKVLDLMDRKVKIGVAVDVIKKLKRSSIETGIFLMLGYPGEEEKDIMETLKFLKKTSPDLFTITLSYPIPGTEFHKVVQDISPIKTGAWGTYSDRELDFKRTYKKGYYHYAIRYVTNEFKAYTYGFESKRYKSLKPWIKSKILRLMMALSK